MEEKNGPYIIKEITLTPLRSQEYLEPHLFQKSFSTPLEEVVVISISPFRGIKCNDNINKTSHKKNKDTNAKHQTQTQSDHRLNKKKTIFQKNLLSISKQAAQLEVK